MWQGFTAAPPGPARRKSFSSKGLPLWRHPHFNIAQRPQRTHHHAKRSRTKKPARQSIIYQTRQERTLFRRPDYFKIFFKIHIATKLSKVFHSFDLFLYKFGKHPDAKQRRGHLASLGNPVRFRHASPVRNDTREPFPSCNFQNNFATIRTGQLLKNIQCYASVRHITQTSF